MTKKEKIECLESLLAENKYKLNTDDFESKKLLEKTLYHYDGQ